jgi:Uma2 family endonuclease
MAMLDFPLLLHYKRFRFDDDEFYDFCVQNDQLKFERDNQGNISIMPNTGGKTGRLNLKLAQQIANWNDKYGLGEAFDSSTAFRLPNTAVRSPDIAWVVSDRWNGLTESEQEKFPPICPDFVIELMSATDTETESKKKMETEWLPNGCQLGWLINPFEQKTYIYRPAQAVEEIVGFDQKLSGEAVLPHFELDLSLLMK